MESKKQKGCACYGSNSQHHCFCNPKDQKKAEANKIKPRQLKIIKV